MGRIKHINHAGRCSKCEEIFNKYEGFHVELKEWFVQRYTLLGTCHISEAGRGEFDQEKHYKAKRSRAHYGQSAHNYNMAIDIFFIDREGKLSYDENRYKLLVRDLPPFINWYGAPRSPFYELPHFEIRGWKNIEDKQLVENT